jgi:multidrug efflux system membrane fusion protein
MNIRTPEMFQAAPSAVQVLPREWTGMARRARHILAGLAILLIAGLAWHFLLESPAPAPRSVPPPPVRIAFAKEQKVEAFQHSIGTVVSISTVQVTALVTGQLLSKGFAEGQIVKSGQVLFQIDPKPFAAALAQARANLARDEANNVSAQHDKARFTTLAAQGAASAQQRDQAIAAADADAATVLADTAAVQTAELNLGYTTIRSPIDGKTGPLLIQPGNLITANNTANPLVTTAQLQPIKVSMFLPQSDLPRIQKQMATKRLIMSVRAGAGTALAAPVDFVGNQVDSKTGTVELRATFDNSDYRLVPGQYVDAAVSLDEFPHAIVVPRDAVNIGPDSRYVFVVGAGDRPSMRSVSALYDDGVNETIQGDVKAGDKVIVEGQLRVIPGKPVQIVNAPRG